MATERVAAPTTLAVVRVLFTLIAIAFGVRAWWVHHRGFWLPPTRAEFERLQNLGLAVWGVGIAAVVAIAYAAPRIRDARRRALAQIVAWSAGEAIACFGAAYYLRTGHPLWFVFGTIAMVGAFLLVPLRA